MKAHCFFSVDSDSGKTYGREYVVASSNSVYCRFPRLLRVKIARKSHRSLPRCGRLHCSDRDYRIRNRPLIIARP